LNEKDGLRRARISPGNFFVCRIATTAVEMAEEIR
jgi:hypothetical protein